MIGPDDIDCESASSANIEPSFTQQNGSSDKPEAAQHMSTSMGKKKVLSKLLGVSEEEMRRNNALRRLGVTEDIVHRSKEILKDVEKMELVTKEERLLGASQAQRSRSKAVRHLGVNEEIIAEDRSRQLGKFTYTGLLTLYVLNSRFASFLFGYDRSVRTRARPTKR